MHDLTSLSVSDILEMSAELEVIGEGSASMEEAADRVVRFLYDDLQDAHSGNRGCALVRVYRTLRFGELDIMLRGFARAMANGHDLSDETACLTMLGTAGDLPAWNDRQRSLDHQTLPLPSEEAVRQMPMVAQLVQQLGYNFADVLNPSPALLLDASKRTHNVFWVGEALGSPHIPAQRDFVVPYRIRSVVGFGSVLPGGDLFAAILFSRVPIPEDRARRFSSLAISIRAALAPHARGAVFEGAYVSHAGRRQLDRGRRSE
jgi:hypothetical protein